LAPHEVDAAFRAAAWANSFARARDTT